MTIRIFIVDDHPIVLDGIVQMLKMDAGFEVVGTADCFEDALGRIETSLPNVAVVDIGLSGKSGIDLIQELKNCHPEVSTIVFSMYDEITFAPKALRFGARGFVMKSEPPSRLITAIKDVYNGKTVVSECVKDLIFEHVVIKGRDASSLIIESKLTQREENIFRLIGQGKSTAGIASKLMISSKTVQAHKDNIRRKLNVKTSSELNRRAILFVASNNSREPEL